jgi:hypothetical protein
MRPHSKGLDQKQAEEHAQQVARDVVARGLASQDVVRKAYFEYVEITRKQGVRGTFPQLLVARGLVDRDKLAQVASARPPSDRTSGLASALVNSSAPVSSSQLIPAPVPAGRPVPSSGRIGPASGARPGIGSTPPPASTPLPPANTPAPTPATLTPPPPAFTPPAVNASGARRGTAALPPRPAPPAATPPPPTVDPDELAVPPELDPGASDVAEDTGPKLSVDELLPSSIVERHRSSAMETQDEAAQAVKKLLADGVLDSAEEVDDEDEEALAKVPAVELKGQLTPQGEPQPGNKIGNYEIISLLGRGGMAAVYRVKDARGDKEMAMKVLTGGDRPGADKRRARFLREVRAVQKLDHPNIVKIHDAARCGPLDFYIMDLVEGEDFEKALAKKKLDLEKRLEIVEGICRAMAHAHERGVIHRDLKPQNVLLDAKTKPRVVDFGLAKVKDDEVSLTRTNTALGTPFYMSPEQHKNAKGIDQRADVFALGVIIYECATGVRPFTGETAAEVGHKVLTIDPPLPSKLQPGKIAPQIDAIVVKALEKDPARRYGSAGALLVDMIRARSGKELVGAKGALGFQAQARKWLEKNRAAVIGGGVVSLVFFPVIIFMAVHGRASNVPSPNRDVVRTDDGGKADPKKPPAPPPGKVPSTPPPPVGQTPPAPPAPPAPTPVANVPHPPSVPVSVPVPNPTSAPATVPAAVATDKPQTPVDLARADLKVPDEATDAAADVLPKVFTPEQGFSFALAYDRLIDTPLARGDLDLAKQGLDAMPNDADVVSFPPLAKDEIAHDLEMLGKLRRFVVERVRADSKLTQSLDLFDLTRQLRSPIKLVEEDALEATIDNARCVFEPLALSLAALRRVIGNEGPPFKLALAVLGMHRGETVRDDFKDLADKFPVAAHRIAWMDALRTFRVDGLALIVKQADADWRAIDADRGKAAIGNAAAIQKKIADYAKTYGRFDSFRTHRPDIVRCAVDSIPFERITAAIPEDKKNNNSWDIKWHFNQPKHSRDFEVTILDKNRPFRAEPFAGGVFLENAVLAIDLLDRMVPFAGVELTSPENEAVTIFGGDKILEFDPKGESRLKDEHGGLLKPAPTGVTTVKSYNLRSAHYLNVTRVKGAETNKPGDSYYLTRINKDDLAKYPLTGAISDDPHRPNRIGVETSDRVRVYNIDGQVLKVEGKRKELEVRLHERSILELRAEAILKTARLLADTAKKHEILLDGEWSQTSGGLEGIGPGTVTTLRETGDGVATFDLVLDDGPGAEITLEHVGGPVTHWIVPAALTPGTPRHVVVTFDVGRNSAQLATCTLDDTIRLETQRGNSDRVGIKIGLLGRTKGTIKNLRLVELARNP